MIIVSLIFGLLLYFQATEDRLREMGQQTIAAIADRAEELDTLTDFVESVAETRKVRGS